MIRDWDDAYENSAYITGAEDLPALWAAQAAGFRAASGKRLQTHAYGPDPRHVFDLIYPEGPPKGLAVFVHGGYWIACSKDDWTHLAQGLVAQGFAVAIPSYRLAPQYLLSDIAQDVAQAIGAAAKLVAGPIRLFGHSAGGHLVTRLVASDSPMPPDTLQRIEKLVPISGLFDLRPLARSAYGALLHLHGGEAQSQSPLMHLPHPAFAGQVTIWVGGAERPEFLRQSRLMALAWECFADLTLHEEAGKNHFSVLDSLADPASALVAAITS